jgi:hypothetical protein
LPLTLTLAVRGGRSPLGIALTPTWRDGRDVGAGQAAEVLGIERARVYQLLEAGKLERGPGGGSR